jgi:hypothetical protein
MKPVKRTMANTDTASGNFLFYFFVFIFILYLYLALLESGLITNVIHSYYFIMKCKSDCDSYDDAVEVISVDESEVILLCQKQKLHTQIQTVLWALKFYNGWK